jgi:hypothetical protein
MNAFYIAWHLVALLYLASIAKHLYGIKNIHAYSVMMSSDADGTVSQNTDSTTE